jgi:hypothetical protein
MRATISAANFSPRSTMLGMSRLDGGMGERGGVLHTAVAQPGLDALGAGSADRSRCLIGGQQQDRPLQRPDQVLGLRR